MILVDTMRRWWMLALSVVILLAGAAGAQGQSAAGRVALGAHGGLSKYWGSFTDDQWWFGGDLFLRWNITEWLSFGPQFGVTALRYKALGQEQPDYFGPAGSTLYPGTQIPIAEKNQIRINTYSGLFSFNLTPEEKLVPYLFAGVGLMNFEPRTLASFDQALPNSQAGLYDRNEIVFPLGAGIEVYLSDNVVLNAKAQFHFTTTDFLDDYRDSGSTSNDAFAALGLGLSYYIFGNLDCDQDGLTDSEEKEAGADPCNADTDGDRLTDFEELRTYSTDPLKADTDGDGLNDDQEIKVTTTIPIHSDPDGDGLTDGEEVNARKTDPRNPDTDADGLTDGDEVKTYRTTPTAADTDTDGLNDGEEVTVHGTTPTAADTDGDGLKDGDEVTVHRTHPRNPDTDGDGLKDGDEVVTHRTDPLKTDTDDDKLADGEELLRTKTDPLKTDTDGDGVVDGDDRCPLVKGIAERGGCPAPPKVGTITNFPDIFFKVNTDEFDFDRPETSDNLARLLQYINQCDGLGVIIEGHASREGSDRRNDTLSEMRARKVKAWLVERRVDPGKIDGTIGYGSRRNAEPEPDPKSKEARGMDPQKLEEIRRLNRRIAVKVSRTCD